MAELKIISMDEGPVEEVEWLWYPYTYGHLFDEVQKSIANDLDGMRRR